jgi:hypothetical protein
MAYAEIIVRTFILAKKILIEANRFPNFLSE